MTRYAIQHRTRRQYLACTPSVASTGSGFQETTDEAEACTWTTRTEAMLELLELSEFADAWEVVPVEVEMAADTPSNAALERIRAAEHARERHDA